MVIVPRIAAVSYLNTIPFIYGIEHEGNLRAELLLSPPSLCAKNFAEHKADIALVPAAAVPSLADALVVTEYCIGAAGPVRTVVLLSNEPIEKARRVFLDAHSLTSVQLAGYLLAKHWKVTPEYYTLEDYAQLGHALPGDAFLLIGDKVFDVQAGDAVFIPAEVPHWYKVVGAERFEFLCLVPNLPDKTVILPA